MLLQNIKGLLTLVAIFIFLSGLFFGYKFVLEPRVSKGKALEQLPVEVSQDKSNDVIKITPQLEVFKDKAIISFESPYESSASVLYSEEKCSKDSCKKMTDSKKTKHEFVLEDLKPNTTYYYKIGIDTNFYPEGDSFFSFKTLEDSSLSNSEGEKNLDFESFKSAIKEQDLEFDLNKDGKVNILDYSFYKKSNQNPQD